jgi:hypothetical protein
MVFVICSPQVAGAQAWTPWLDRDDPSGKGDYETVADFTKAGKVCDKPIQIQCRFVGETNPWPATPPTGYTCNTQLGGYCVNEPGLECKDIEVRFLCPKGLEGRTPTASGMPSEKPKAGETTLDYPYADRLTLSGTGPHPKDCSVTAKLSHTGHPGYTYENKTVTFIWVKGPSPAPSPQLTDAASEAKATVKGGQTVRAETLNYPPNHPPLKSNDFTCRPIPIPNKNVVE